MFEKILIANRGEIACRVMRTCRTLGVRTVAVYSDADAHALHTEMADEAVHIGPAQASQSYLSIAAMIDAARATGAQAIHPGYGFLSENADFADAVAQAGLILIGPPASCMRAMGSKAAAKALMAQAGVTLVPGYHGDAQDAATLAAQAFAIGFPVLIKASAGGGGRGMRIVEHQGALQEAIEGAAREAAAAFGDGRLLIEKYLTRPRHIEIQVFADSHGNTVSLFERDCSIQRRHQKVIEEAPAPGLPESRRRAMGDAAVAAAQAVGYIGAGTVEFIVENNEFYFMEMNTRLQVEHPVTEMITGLDLAEWQLRVASGEPLPRRFLEPAFAGHAIEARIYAEDPQRGFMPSIGRLAHLRTPEASANIRIDSGVREGDTITPYYDAMIAKLIVHGENRGAALRHLRAALAQYEVVGVHTNLDLLRAIAAEPDFAAADLDTGFIARHSNLLAPTADQPPPAVWAAAVLVARAARSIAPQTADPWSPWNATDTWRMNVPGQETLCLAHCGVRTTIQLSPEPDGLSLDLPQGRVHAFADTLADGQMRLSLDGTLHRLRVVRRAAGLTVIHHGRNYDFDTPDPLAAPASARVAAGKLTAPIPARITRILAAVGDTVARGAALVVLEAMKMELTITAPSDGTIAAIPHAVGDMVQEGAELVRLTTTDVA